jgi:hypothetical protein
MHCNMNVKFAIRVCKKEWRWTVVDKCSQIVAYADGVVIMGWRLQDAREVFILLFEQTNKMGLEINEKNIYIICDTVTVALH